MLIGTYVSELELAQKKFEVMTDKERLESIPATSRMHFQWFPEEDAILTFAYGNVGITIDRNGKLINCEYIPNGR